jgi:muramoyltetrapeptide carboxypeptidase LdcA involved in peptidoglycan recycling
VNSYGIGLFAPAGFAPEPAAIDRAAARLRTLGHHVVLDPTCKMRWQRFAGPTTSASRA